MKQDIFSRDLNQFLKGLKTTTDSTVMRKLAKLRRRLVRLRKRRLVKINHSVLELLCACHLLKQGYEVTIEKPLLNSNLIADIYATRNNPETLEPITSETPRTSKHEMADLGENMVVEVETGYVPPDAALAPGEYRQVRMAAKIARYSGHAQRFGLATPRYHVLQVPHVLLKHPENRDRREVQQLKKLCDSYYNSPPIMLEALARVEVDAIYILNVDRKRVVEISPHRYLDTILRADGLLEA